MYDAIVVGGGHNGLVAASYLAKAGLKVCVLERRPILGGACVSEELWPGVKVSTGAYVLSLLRERIIEDLRLKEFGLKVYTKDPGVYLPFGGGKHLRIWVDTRRTQKEIERFSKRDAESYAKWVGFWEKFSELADTLMLTPPPRLGELRELVKLADSIGFDEEFALDFARVFLTDAKHFVEEYFESEEVRAAMVGDGVVGTFAAPSTPGTAYVLAHHVVGSVNGVKGAWGYVEGGMGGVTTALARCATSLGVDIYTSSPVDEILTGSDGVKGVKLQDGRVIEAKCVISNADPKATFLYMLRNAEVDPQILRRIRGLKTTGVSFKLVGYLSELPDYGMGTNLGPEHVASEYIMPSVDYVEKAYRDALTTGFSRDPWLSVNIQSSVDPTVAPRGYYSFSVFGQYLVYSKKLDDLKQEVAQVVIDKVREYAPNFNPIKFEVLTPLDIERRFGITGGNIFHLDMTPDQLYVFRPLPELSRYQTNIKGLFLCGSGTHPGGGVTGAPGYNAAQEVINWLKHGV
ncbi:MAG: NAD(P)/FAD-dependent oxidoreductase [Thermoprotei archaeon]